MALSVHIRGRSLLSASPALPKTPSQSCETSPSRLPITCKILNRLMRFQIAWLRDSVRNTRTNRRHSTAIPPVIVDLIRRRQDCCKPAMSWFILEWRLSGFRNWPPYGCDVVGFGQAGFGLESLIAAMAVRCLKRPPSKISIYDLPFRTVGSCHTTGGWRMHRCTRRVGRLPPTLPPFHAPKPRVGTGRSFTGYG